MYLNRELLGFTAGLRSRVVVSAALGLVGVVLGIARLALLGWLLARVFAGAGLSALLLPIAAVVTVIAARSLVEYARTMLAHHTGASVIPAFVLGEPGSRYRAFACPRIEMAAGELRETLPINVQRIADLFETLIRRHPEQWFNYVPLFSAS